MRKLIIVLFCLISLVTKAQVYQEMPQYGYRANRMSFDSTLQIPTTCGVPTLKSVVNVSKKAAIAFDSCNNKFYQYNPKTLTWSEIAGGGGIDTTSLSNRINLKVNISDTSTMLNPYLRKIDTANKWINAVTKLNDSTLQVIKGTTTTDLIITGVSYAKKLKTQVWNNTGVTINKGSVVYISGRHSSNLPTIALAQADNEANSYKTFAIVENDILDNSEGTIIQAGNIGGLNLPTSSYTDGDIVYLSTTVPGGLTITKPLAPYHICKIGSVTRAHPTQGSIEVKIENGWQLDELSDVQVPAVPNDSTLLQFSRVDSLWHSVSVTNAIGTKYLKPTDTTSLSLRINTKLNASDSSIYYTKYRSDTSRNNIYSAINSKGSGTVTSVAALTLGTSGTDLTSTVATGTTTPVITLNVPTASASNRGALSSTDWSTFNNKGYALNIGGTLANLSANLTYYFGAATQSITTTAAIRRLYIPYAGTIKGGTIYARTTTATSSENWTISIRLNNSSNTTFATLGNTSIDKIFTASGLNISVAAGDYIEITTTTPAWVTAPSNTWFYGSIFIQ